MSQTETKLNQDDTAGEGEKKIKMIPDISHGPNFEWRLLTLFCVRALGAGYKFEVTKEWEDLGGKFDDAIIRYRVVDDTLEGSHWRYRFLQAKHKKDESEKIKAIELLKDDDNNFSLPKYFRSFCMIKRRGEDIHDCILCTNIGFDLKNFQEKGIELVSINDQPEDILEFGPQQKTLRYKLRFTNELRRKAFNDWSDVYRFAIALQKCACEDKTDGKNEKIFQRYYVALIEEKVIDSATKKFHEDFVNEKEKILSNGAQQLRQTLSDLAENDWKKWEFKLNNEKRKSDKKGNPLPLKISEEKFDQLLDAFLEKLVFVVNTPNVNNLKAILQAQDMSKYYPLEKCEDQTLRFLDRMQMEFFDKKVGYCLTPEKSKEILLAGVTTTSQKYQKELDNEVGFNDVAIDKMADKLRALLANNKRIERITTPAPKHTAVKVVSAIRKLPEYDRSGSFLMTILGCLEDRDDRERWKNILKLKTDSHHLLIVVCENETPDADDYADLVPGENMDNKVFFIGRNGVAGMMDDITFEELNEKFQNAVLSIEEMLFQKKDVNIPRADTSECEESLYIKRKLTMAYHESFENKLAERLKCTINELHEKCRITPQGEIKWFVENQDRESIWKEIKNLADEGMSSNAIDESQLICLDEGREQIPIVIISGVAGTGKSTILSNYYMEMKRVKPDHWIIRINLVEQQTAFLELVTADKVVDFFVKQLHIAEDESPFSRSLLRHRIETGDRIAFMFDGFDEISYRCQQNVIRLMKILARKKTIKLYVTTRPHIADELQFELSQLAHHLQILAEKDQIDYLVRYWQSNLREMEMENKSIIIQTFAESLTHRVSQTLRDEEKSFIGVPLQCRILAECYQFELEKQIKNNNAAACETLVHQHFDLKSLYERLLDTKRRIFREEKAESPSFNQVGSCAMDFLIDDIESHLTKLAIETLVVERRDVTTLWPSQLPYLHSAAEKSEKENKITELGVKYGLIVRSKSTEKSEVQFLHRTYAEYLFARYLHRGMDINNFDTSQLLSKKPESDLVINEVLVEKKYDGVRVFLNFMLKKTEDKKIKLPRRLHKFAKSLEEHIKSLPRHASPRDRHTNALTVALQTSNLFQFLLDCLDETLNETERKRVVRSALQHHFHFSTFLYRSNGRLFQRVLSYYDDADAVDVERIVKKLLHEPLTAIYSPDSSYVIVWNNERAKDVVEEMLKFMEKNGENLKPVLKPEHSGFSSMHTSVTLLHFFIFNEYYNCLLSQFLRFLSSIYADDHNFTELLDFTLNMQDYNNDNWTFPSNNGIEKTLDILRDLSRPRVMEGLCHLALVTDLFEKYYQPSLADDEDSLKAPARMTRLHWAAFNGDVEAIESIGDRTCSMDDSFTPFYVAAARHHREICHKILSLFKTSLTDDELRRHVTKYKGFIHKAMWDAIYFHNLTMFQLILQSTKQALGRHYLMALLKSEKPLDLPVTKEFFFHRYNFLSLKNGKELFKITAKVLLDDGSQEEYADLNDLVFHKKDIHFLEARIILNNIEEETFHRMVEVNGLENCTKRFLDYTVVWGFRLLSTVIARFTLNQRREFINIITSPNIPTYQSNQNNVSYWGTWFENEFTYRDFECLDQLLKSLEDNIPKLIFNYNSNDAIKALLCQNSKLVTLASKHFSRPDYLKIKRRIIKNGPKVMNELFTSQLTQERVVRNWINILPFHIGKKGKYHFRKLVDNVLSLHTEKHGKKTIWISLWSKYVDSHDYDGNKVEKVDQFLKLVSDKLGKRAVRKVVLHKDCMGIVLLGAELQQDKKLANALLTHLSAEDRHCIEHLVKTSVFS